MPCQRKITTLEQMWTLSRKYKCVLKRSCFVVLYFCFVGCTEVLNAGTQFATAPSEKKHCTKIHHSTILGLVFIGLIKVRSIHSAQSVYCTTAPGRTNGKGILLYKSRLRRFCLHHRKTPNCSCFFKTLFIPTGQLNTKRPWLVVRKSSDLKVGGRTEPVCWLDMLL